MTWTPISPSSSSWSLDNPNSSSWDSSTPLVQSRMLQEDGSFLLQEDLFYILLNDYDWSSLSEDSGNFVIDNPTNTNWTESIPN